MKIKQLVVTDDSNMDHSFTSKSLLNTTTVEEAGPVVEVVPVDPVVEPAPTEIPTTDDPAPTE